jgi:predicted ATP-grasp superfamily ATP-dependent carboligase
LDIAAHPPDLTDRLMTILVLCSNPDLGLGVIRCLGMARHQVYAMGVEAWPLYRLSRHCRRYTALNGNGLHAPPDYLARKINEHCRKHGIEIVIPSDIPAALALNDMQQQLQVRLFPVTSSDTLNRLHDKWTFAQFMSEFNLPHPQTRLVNEEKDVDMIDLPAPWIVKPRLGEGGIGVMRVESAQRLKEIVRADPRPRLAQEFLPGRDIDLSFLADRGRIVAWTIQATDGPPSRRVFLDEPRVLEIGREMAAACAYHGAAHVDMRFDDRDGTIKVLECNPRFWNTLTHSLCVGVNFPDLGLSIARGEVIAESSQRRDAVCSMFHVTPWRLLISVLSARPPSELGAEAEEMWQQIGSDPVPELYRYFEAMRGRPRH